MSDQFSITRPDPEVLLRTIQREHDKEGKGALKIFFGMCAGVGKTYEMLQAAQEAKKNGTDVVIGYVETHRRAETEALVKGLPVVPRKTLEYRGTSMEEMDLDAILARKPALVLVDELAHTNAPGSRHTKRYLDVTELLDHGIDVYTTLNVQHLESRADAVAKITGAVVRETVPDSIYEQADEIEVIDLPPDELLKRLADGKVYTAERSRRAIDNFFRKGNLTALREMSLRLTAERVEHQLRDYAQDERITGSWKSGQRIVMGISPSPSAVHLIRWARRIAFTMNVTWVGVYIERSRSLNEQEKHQLAENISLARELGAEIITTADEDIAAALLRVAKEKNATQIIVGKSQRRFPFQKTVLERLLRESGDIDLYVVGSLDKGKASKTPIFSPSFQSRLSHYLISTAIIVALSLTCFPFRNFLGYQTVSLILLLAVALLPLRFGAGPVVLAAAVSALVWDFFFIPPRFTFLITSGQDILMIFAYFAIAVVTGVLTVRVRTRERTVRLREEKATALYTLTNDLSSTNGQDAVVQAGVLNIGRFFQADVVVFLNELDGDFLNVPHPRSTYKPGQKELGVSSWVHWNEKSAGKFTDTLPFAEATYFPLSGPRYPLGVIGVKPRNRLTFDQETLLQNFISQIASALDREFLNEMTKRSISIAESERLYTTLFNSISHEMRTPITALLGTAESLTQQAAGARTELIPRLAGEVQAAAHRLDQIVQNLLDMTRIESGLLQPKLDWCDVHDLLNAVLKKLRTDLSEHTVALDLPSSLPLLRLDFTLIEQSLINILRNTATHTAKGTAVRVTASVEKSQCVISISDNGPGFPPEEIDKIFDKFYRGQGTKRGGLGLGLSIAFGFIRAHNGTLTVSNAPGGGAMFTVRLPIPEPPPVQATDD
jgi:two-component system sensor histidine kinase KdpD